MSVIIYSLQFWHQPITRQEMTCSGCGYHGEVHDSDAGVLCTGCCQRHSNACAEEHVRTVRQLAAAYQLDPQRIGDDFAPRTFLEEGLGDSRGKVRIKPASNKPRMRLLWHPNPEALVANLRPNHVGLQIQTAARIVWALCLRFGGDMVDIEEKSPRGGHYCHTEIPWLSVEWAAQHVTHWWWLSAYMDALCADYIARNRKHHSSLTPERRTFYTRHIGDAVFDGRLSSLPETPAPLSGAVRLVRLPAVHLPDVQRRAA